MDTQIPTDTEEQTQPTSEVTENYLTSTEDGPAWTEVDPVSMEMPESTTQLIALREAMQRHIESVSGISSERFGSNTPTPTRAVPYIDTIAPEPDPSPQAPNIFLPELGSAHLSICLQHLMYIANGINVASIRRQVITGLDQALKNLSSDEPRLDRVAQYCEYVRTQISNTYSFAEYHQQAGIVRNRKTLRKQINKPDSRSWFHLPMGIEYTFHFPGEDSTPKRGFGGSSDAKAYKIKEDMQTRLNTISEKSGKSVSVVRTYIDQTALEVCSPVHKNWQAMSSWYEWLAFQAKDLKLKPWSATKGGGGGHINVSTPYKKVLRRVVDTEFMFNLLVDVANRPYLNWIFNDPSDNHTANCLWWNSHMIRMYDRFKTADEKKKRGLLNDLSSRGYSIRVKDDFHFELRLFDMVRCKKDLLDHMKFVSAYTKWIKKRTDAGDVFVSEPRLDNIIQYFRPTKSEDEPESESPPGTRQLFALGDSISTKRSDEPETVTGFDMKGSIAEFKTLLSLIGLEYKDYRRFVERNLRARFNPPYGEKYLK